MEEKLEKLLQKLAQMEDEEDNLAMVPVYEEALQLSKEIYGDANLKTLEIYNNYGGHLRNLGLYDKAEQLLRDAVVCAKKVRGEMHPDYATTLVNLANLLRMMHQFDESEQLFLQALSLYECTIGSKHFLYVGAANNLGLLYFDKKEKEKALPYFLHCVRELEGKAQCKIPYAITLHNLVDIYKEQGKRTLAKETLEKEIAIYKEMHYEGTVLYAAALNSLGVLYYEDGDYEAAYEAMKESVDIAKVHLGESSESYQHGVKNLEMIEKKRKTTCNSKKKAIKEATHPMKGLELCKAYFYEVCYPVLEREFQAYLPRMAAGLIGEGSECYGFDDVLSQDHDFGPAFQIFIPREDMAVYGEKLKARLSTLPKEFQGFKRIEEVYGQGRTGVFSIEDFYKKFIEVEGIPDNINIWRQIPEYALSTVTNGEVFFDNYGAFSQIREQLKKGYPDAVRIKKIAARLMKMAQSGQYNFPRCLKREEYVAAQLALSEFMQAAMSLVYLLNRTYSPYYKWMHKGLAGLPILGKSTYEKMGRLSGLSLKNEGKEMEWLVEEICNDCLAQLQKEGLSKNPETFLLVQGPEVLKNSNIPSIQHSDPWVE